MRPLPASRGGRTFLFSVSEPDRSILRRAVFVVGPTSSGKSAFALDLAQKHGGEIVCADAFQLYREFPVLSAQPAAGERALVPHHLFGAGSCADDMDAARYAALALGAIADILARGRIPIVVGGSGLYIQALTAGLPELPPIDAGLRERVRGMTLKEMAAKLGELDPASLDAIDTRNPRRVARRLELCLQAGRPASEILHEPPSPQGLRGVVLTRDRDDLDARIAAAVDARLSGGAIDEVRATRRMAGGTARQILGWREISGYLDAKILLDECRDDLTAATRRYAKRQLTWFRAKCNFPAANLSSVTTDFLDRTARELGLP